MARMILGQPSEKNVADGR